MKKHCFLVCFYAQVLDLHLSCNQLIKAATLVQIRMPEDTSYFNVYALRSLTFSQTIHLKSLAKLFVFHKTKQNLKVRCSLSLIMAFTNNVCFLELCLMQVKGKKRQSDPSNYIISTVGVFTWKVDTGLGTILICMESWQL